MPELLAERLTARFPGLKVAGTYSPPFRPLTPEEDEEIVERINAAAPDLVWVGLSTPKQERWMAAHVGRLDAPALLGVGAAFDIHAGLLPQARRGCSARAWSGCSGWRVSPGGSGAAISQQPAVRGGDPPPPAGHPDRRRASIRNSTTVLVDHASVLRVPPEAIRLAQTLAAPGSGFLPLGYVQPHGAHEAGDTLPVLGGIDQLRELIAEQSVDCLFVASTLVESDALEVVSQAGRRQGVQVLVSANMNHVLSSRVALQQVGSVIALALRPVRLTGTQAVAKRAFDLVAGSLALVVTLPVWLAAAIAIRLTSPGPVFFHQERVTKGGRTFRMHKFRTMRQDLPAGADTTVPFFKVDQDPRITRVGHRLRKWSLDELPQLWNVIRGEMSLVGPRPLPTEQVAANLELLGPRHEVPAGMTGWWQINGRSDVAPAQAVRLDAFYIENWSLAFDFYIALKTMATVVERKGAY